MSSGSPGARVGPRTVQIMSTSFALTMATRQFTRIASLQEANENIEAVEDTRLKIDREFVC